MTPMIGLKSIREAKGLSREKLAASVNPSLSASAIYQLETGRIADPAYSVVTRIAAFFEVAPASLFLVENTDETVFSQDRGPTQSKPAPRPVTSQEKTAPDRADHETKGTVNS